MGDKVLVVGTGGREHALAWKLAQSLLVETVYANADWVGVTEKCTRANFDIKNAHEFASDKGVDLTVVGPEAPLVDGIADLFLEKGLRLFGSTRRAARLESIKAYAKEFMREYGIPTAPFVTRRTYRGAVDYLENDWPGPVYVKASGLAGGKGALPGHTQDEALKAVRRIMIEREFGDAGDEIVIEQFLDGEEASCTALFNTESLIAAPLLFSQDHKKLRDNDEGPNTGGMGAYAPTTLVTPEIAEKVYNEILGKTSNGLRYERILYKGFLYPGLMIHNGMPNVLEFNVRLGDPEAQAVLPLLESDLYEALVDTIEGRRPRLAWKPGYVVYVVFASRGYPEVPSKDFQKPENRKEIHRLDVERDNVYVFHAGTIKKDGRWYTYGGRVAGVTGYGPSIGEAIDRSYGAIGQENNGIWFEDMQFRRDIGKRELMRTA